MAMQKTNLHGFTVYYDDQQEFHSLKNEVFTQHVYYFESDNPHPVIIDAGAHIGLATLYFKKQFPGAQITAIEPHPANVKLLEHNVFENRLDNVMIIEGALVGQTSTETVTLHVDADNEWLSTTSVRPGAWTGDQSTQELKVQSFTLAEFLTVPVDLLKLDIEGAELEVLESCQDHLYLVNHAFIEFHPHSGQSLDRIIKLLEDQSFHLSLSKKGKPIRRDEARGLVMIEASR